MQVFPIHTERLDTRPLATIDQDLFVQLYTDEETMRFIGTPLTADRAAASFASALRGLSRNPIQRLFLTVLEKATGAAVGICNLQDCDLERRRVQAGVMLLQPVRAKGYAKEIFVGLIQQVFARLPVDEVWVQFTVDHIAVQRGVLSVGFVQSNDSRDGPARMSVWAVHRNTWSPPM